jgi:hypothetical protein
MGGFIFLRNPIISNIEEQGDFKRQEELFSKNYLKMGLHWYDNIENKNDWQYM